jgi:hypothetical protein
VATLILSGSVGANGKNDPSDVAKVCERLVELGYTRVKDCKKGKDQDLVLIIKLIQSMIRGSGKIDKGDGTISHTGETHRWLAAQNAPAWVKVYGESGIGWKSTMDYTESNGGYATSWMLERLKWTGIAYRAAATFTVANAPQLWVRECSPKLAGKNPTGHKSHETGLDVDIRLPLLPPHTNDWFQLREHNYSKLFHFDAAILQCEMLKKHMDSKYIFFNDPRFIKKHLTSQEANHSEHYHVRIKPPNRIDGIVG